MLSREDGIPLVEAYDDACSDEYIASFSEFIGITVEEFWAQVHAAMNHELFYLDDNGRVQRRFEVGVGL